MAYHMVLNIVPCAIYGASPVAQRQSARNAGDAQETRVVQASGWEHLLE